MKDLINTLRNTFADTLVGWAVQWYSDDDLKFSLAAWIIRNFKGKVTKR